jgi:hypothetical protein
VLLISRALCDLLIARSLRRSCTGARSRKRSLAQAEWVRATEEEEEEEETEVVDAAETKSASVAEEEAME